MSYIWDLADSRATACSTGIGQAETRGSGSRYELRTPDVPAFRNSYLVTRLPHRYREVEHHMDLQFTDQEAE